MIRANTGATQWLQCGVLMLWPLIQCMHRLSNVAVWQWLHKVRILSCTMNAWHHVTVITKEVQSLMWIEQKFKATVALQNKGQFVVGFVLEKAKLFFCSRSAATSYYSIQSFIMQHKRSHRKSLWEFFSGKKINGKFYCFCSEWMIYLQSNDRDNMALPQKYRMRTWFQAPAMSHSTFGNRIYKINAEIASKTKQKRKIGMK